MTLSMARNLQHTLPPLHSRERTNAMDEITTATQHAHDTIERTHDTVERARDTAHKVVDRASASAQRLSASGQQLSDDLGTYMSAHPVQTLAIALATGFVLGRLMR
jgi:ElaB/YqjD/DUF883 family membrane-anchored ribosome-binding protein